PASVSLEGEGEFSSKPCDPPFRHSYSSISATSMRSNFPPSRKDGISPRSIMFRTWRSEQDQRSASMAGVYTVGTIAALLIPPPPCSLLRGGGFRRQRGRSLYLTIAGLESESRFSLYRLFGRAVSALLGCAVATL